MLIVMKPDATDRQVEEVLKVITDLGLKPHPMPGDLLIDCIAVWCA